MDGRRERRKKSSVYMYTRFPVIDDDDDDEEEEELDGGSHITAGQMEPIVISRSQQLLAALAANMGALALGTVLSWSAVALPDLRNDNQLNVTVDEESWIGSIVSLGAVAAGPVGGLSIEWIGRRGSMMLLSIPFSLSWLLIHFSRSVPILLTGRFCTGFFAGTFAVAAPIFTAEVTDQGIRGAVGSTFDMMISLGILLIYILGAFLHWRTQALICAIMPLVVFVLMVFVPESPFYLVKKGKSNQATNSLMKYRGANHESQVQWELREIQREVECTTSGSDAAAIDKNFCVPWVLMPVWIGLMVYIFQVISGLDPVLVYTVDIFKLAGADLNEYTSTIIIGTIQTLAGVVAASVVDRSGRRFLLLISEASMIVALTLLGLYFHLKVANGGVDPPGLGWLPVTTLSVYVFSYSVGLGPVGYCLVGEILPLQVKGLAGCILTSAKWFMSFIMTKFFHDLLTILGDGGCFWLFALFCSIGFLYIFIFVPETKGASLEDIQRYFRRRFKRNSETDEERNLITSPVARREYQAI